MGINLANAERLAMLAMASAIEPSPLIDYLGWAVDNVVIEEGSFRGPYNRGRFPYFDEILRALSPADPCRFVTLLGSAQVGKTTIANVFTCGTMALGKGTFLYAHPTEDNASRWSKIKLASMTRAMPALRADFPQRSRDGADAVLFKERRDGNFRLLIFGANSPASLSQVTVDFQVQDDLAKWDLNAAGDPESQADNRSRAVEFAKVLKISTPLVMPGCRITKNFEAGSQEYPYVPCPHCDHYQVLEWENMLASLDPEKPEAACFSCVACGVTIEEHHRPQMLARFEWRAHNARAKREHRSFWIWSAYSYLQSFERIAREYLKYKGDQAGEKTFANDTTGKPYHALGEAPPWEKLRDRAAASSYPRGKIPPGALLIFLGIDCQGDRVEWHLVGFGRNYRRFVVDYGIVRGHISEKGAQETLGALLQQTWLNASGHALSADMAAIDGNAWTEDVWSFAKKFPRSKLIMVRGSNRDEAPRFIRVRRETNEKTGKLLRYASRFYNFNASIMKMGFYRDLAKDDPLADGYVSFPQGLDDEYFRQLTAERRTPEKRHGFTVYRWTKDAAQANEALDTMNQAEAASIRFGVRGMPDQVWTNYELERETAIAPMQGDLEDLLTAPQASPAAPAAAVPAKRPAPAPKPAAPRIIVSDDPYL
ncbi:phage terminase large subunit family protein [Bradyrhizobium sp. JYMT SZCCT0428]|uniref:phage terminase large subunit family protein n=1 Tax=Bradyrhizobium sp. JYMT SZCCT0428 TaxID=2807673 RepID=UPI001BA9F2EF|nr:terminase gpA endonuclease subunit [Bradyrhizobium sp. JYMT SZCCT0428]MBR1150102.1 phage terminase large subunit family protein [Bradyrhizobium sp. JYMT SZCCT0428]